MANLVKMFGPIRLSGDDLLTATEQAGPYASQADPATANAGKVRPIISGTPADFTFTGTTTSDGNVGGTTLIDSYLAGWGDDFFIGAKVTITSGVASGEYKEITDFAQSTGTITVTSAFSAKIVSGVTFTIILRHASLYSGSRRQFGLEVIASGDPGAATWVWQNDTSGTQKFGRKFPNAASSFDAPRSLGTLSVLGECRQTQIVEADNGNWVLIFQENVTADWAVRISTDEGDSWSAAVGIGFDGAGMPAADITVFKVKSGRIYVFVYTHFSYSDDNGATWSNPALNDGETFTSQSCVELPSGQIGMAFYTSSNVLYYKIGMPGAWSDRVTVYSSANIVAGVSLLLDKIGQLHFFFSYDNAGDTVIKETVSTDFGATWATPMTIISSAGKDVQFPTSCMDIQGDLWVAAHENTADEKIVFSVSTDNGATWGAKTDLYSVAGHDLSYPGLSLLDGHYIVCTYQYDATTLYNVRSGYWSNYATNSIPMPINGTRVKLMTGFFVTFLGGAAVAGDEWTFQTEFYNGAKNIFLDSPSKSFRSVTDGAACEIIFDTGSAASGKDRMDAFGFFGCNVGSLKVQANATNAWTTPSIDETVSFFKVSGAVDATSSRHIKDSSLLANYKDHELTGYYLRATSGAVSGTTWKILDNVGSYFLLDGSLGALAPADTFNIFAPQMVHTFTPTATSDGIFRFIRILITAQETNTGYYELGTVIMGVATAFAQCFAKGYNRDHVYDIQHLGTPSGGIVSVSGGAAKKRMFSLSWARNREARKEVLYMMDQFQGKTLAFVPNDSDLLDVFPVRLTSNVSQTQEILDYMTIGPITLEEVL